MEPVGPLKGQLGQKDFTLINGLMGYNGSGFVIKLSSF